MIEIWRSVVGYEGYYEVSNWGRVKSLNYKRTGKEKIMQPAMNKWGYLHLLLSKDGKVTHYSIHRLVAEAFIPNPQNLPQVNHRNEDKTDNRVENLEWVTAKENANYGTRIERAVKLKCRTVLQFTLSGEFIREWSSASEVERQTGWRQGNISKCCNGHRRYTHAYGYVWRYKEKTASEQSEAVSAKDVSKLIFCQVSEG